MDGNGPVLGDIQNQIGQQIVVPHPHQLQNTDADHGGLQHGQHHAEEGPHRTAAVDGSRLLNLQRQALHKAHEHEDGQTGSEAQIDHRNRPGGVQMGLLGGLGQGKHDHLEGDDHGEQAQIVEQIGRGALDPGDVPCAHGAAQQNQTGGHHGDEYAVTGGLQEGVVAEGEALQVVCPAYKGFLVGQRKGIQVDEAVALERVDHNLKHREHPDGTQHHKETGENGASQGIFLGFHYCCTSLERVAYCWVRARTATSRKKITALA